MRNNYLLSKTATDRTLVFSIESVAEPEPMIVYRRPYFRVFSSILATLIATVSSLSAQDGSTNECLARVEKKSIIDKYERRLFVTPDEVARYVFLTNRRDDGDRSAAVYRVRRKTGSLPGEYWITVTEAPDSLRAETRNIRVERHDAPLPASVANALHALWEAVLKGSRLDDHAIPCAPTAVFSAKITGGARLTGVTVDLPQGSICVALIDLGELLIDYAKLPMSRRLDAASRLEKESQRLLARVSKKR